jgi:peptide-methionine (S)-S-oxide reductase
LICLTLNLRTESHVSFRKTASALALVAAFAFGSPLNAQAPKPATRDTAVFAGGCFWGVEAVFARVKGVLSSTSGYAGGKMANPSYEDVSTGSTGHAESVQVIYDPSKVTYDQLLDVFFAVAHDPTQLNYQGPDHGTQYRSAIFYKTPAQVASAKAFIAKLTQAKKYAHSIVTEVSALKTFYAAEAYHQGYFDTHPDQPYIVYNDKPKVDALKKQFAGLYNGK